MSESKMRGYRKVLIVVPVLLLFAAIAISQLYVVPAFNDPPPNNDLQLLGYGSNGGALTLSNVGTRAINILNVTYDSLPLAVGTIGGTVPMFATSGSQNSSLCYSSTDDLIFPRGGHWNMDTGGLCSATILPDGVASLYLGVFSNTNSSHLVVIVTQEGNYTFTV